MDITGKCILVTGAQGFIGGRLAERLVREYGARVRGLARAAGVGRSREVSSLCDVEIVIGDITDVEAARRAVDGCAAVVHCAAMQGGRHRLADFRRVNVGGTLNLLRAAHEARLARFVHLSTINVHGVPPPRDACADSPLVFAGDFYSISKAEGERAAWQFARDNDVPLVVIRPGCTYGPRSHAWTLKPLERVRRGAPVLIGGGNGICNAIYIDNLIDLILLALQEDAAIGHAFIGAEGRGVTWREFYGAYARMLGGRRLNGMPRRVALALAMMFEGLARLDGYPPRVARANVEFYSHQVVFDIEKSRRWLGYAPRVSFAEGMARTQEWLRAENIL